MKKVLILITVLITFNINAQRFILGEKLADIKSVINTKINEAPEAIECERQLTDNTTAYCLVSYATKKVYVESIEIKNTPFTSYVKVISDYKEEIFKDKLQVIQDDFVDNLYTTIFTSKVYVSNALVDKITCIKYDIIGKNLKVITMIKHYNK